MSFGFGNSAGAGGASSGPDLETIQTEALGFLTIAGEAKLRLTSSWSPLPAPTASLLSIASGKGLVAAAGPDQVIIATTESVRKALEKSQEGDSDIRGFEPQLKIPMPMRISQLAFTADENYLILSAESGGGLAVYEVQNLLQGSTNSAFELPTNGETLRLLAPNPTAEKAELCAIVTTSGKLHMANLKERTLSGVLKDQVSSACWSSKGKQLCAGLGNGTIYQMTPEGEGKGEIPRPPGLGDCHISSLGWLENHLFLAIYRPTNDPASSVYYIITRQPPSSFSFQKIADPVEPFGAEKTAHHSILRLRDFPPNLQDLLIVSSTASTEVGLLSRSKVPLASDKPAEAITGVFTTTELADDTKRPTLPMTDSMDDSTPVGVALDLSSKDKVYKPIPSDEELEESPSPLPGFWVMTHEGILCCWWLVYTDSIKQGTSYPGLMGLSGSNQAALPAPAPAASSPFSALGGSPLGGGSTSSPAPAFGASSQLGQKASPWGTPSAASQPPASNTGGATFGSSGFANSTPTAAPAFGKPSAIGFGQSSQIGMRTSPWATSASSFGQSSFGSLDKGNAGQSPFGSVAANSNSSSAPGGGGFAGFASKSGFSALSGGSSVFGSNTEKTSSLFGGNTEKTSSPFSDSADNTSSPFGSTTEKPSPFGSTAEKPSPFGSTAEKRSPFGSGGAFKQDGDTAFPPKQDKPSGDPFGSTPFKLQSSFKPDPSAQDDARQPPAPSSSSMGFGGLGSILDDTVKQSLLPDSATKDDDMDTADASEPTPRAKQSSPFARPPSPESTTPTTTPAPPKFSFVTASAPMNTSGPGSGLFGASLGQSKPFVSNSIFGQSSFKSIGENKSGSTTPKIKVEEDAPLPPDTTSKAAYPIGDSSSSSAASTVGSRTFGSATTAFNSESSGPAATPKFGAPSIFTTTSKPSESISSGFVNVSRPATKTMVTEDAPLPPSTLFSKPSAPKAPVKPDDAPLPPDFIAPKAPSRQPSGIPPVPDLEEEEESDLDESAEEEEEEEDDNATEGSGVDVAKDLGSSMSNIGQTPGMTPQSSFGGLGGTTPATARPANEGGRSLFGEISRNAPMFPRPHATSPRSPSPVRGAIPNRVIRTDSIRSVSTPAMASQLLGHKGSQSQLGGYIASKERQIQTEDPFMQQQRRMKARQQAEEAQPLVDKEDDEIQKLLASEVQGTLELDEFIAHSNIVPPAKESVPSQVEAVYRDINSMIDTFGMNLRGVKGFIKGHTESAKEGGRTAADLEVADDWVLCEVNQLGEVLDTELYPDLEEGRVQDLEEKLQACQELGKDMHRLRAKQEDLKRILMTKMDPDQADVAKSMPLSAEQAAQQNELRREFTNFAKLLAQAEEALTLLKTRIASASSTSGRGNSNVPTVEAIIRTIGKMTSMVEKRSGDIDVLENELRKMRLSSVSREASPMMTPQGKRSVKFPMESTPTRSLRHSISSTPGALVKATPPRKKLSGFSKEEKGDLMDKRARRQAVLGKLKTGVEKRGVTVWNMEDIE
ncbi:hypothetical protein B0I35DRAFT_385799 [Stachybotrys elegans]|uniref:Nucleoporin Nup159/Nup146 N-terminal domain-containing protein n=1 Tax=Stachybotrys elegans TaxID=80388 RepID=A0A8K0T3V0_9HYPO|nr:hypothetical protein B0I35DRAFT_385799 [Stachybotrys elegans]